MNGIVIEGPRQKAAHRSFDYLVELGQLGPGRPMRCVALIAPTQSGKSTIIGSYAHRLNSADAIANGEIPALSVTLQANVTRRQFAQDILHSFEEHGACDALTEVGTESYLLRRVVRYLKERRVRVLFLDEFHHLVHSDNRNVVVSVSETVKWLLEQGACPIVVAGLKDARRPFNLNKQLAARAEPALSLQPLDPHVAAHATMFREFLSDYLVAADRLGAAGRLPELLAGDVAACLWEISRGVMGVVCNLVKFAVMVAAENGRWDVERDDLVAATDHLIASKFHDRNPFREGLGPIQPAEDE